MRAPASVATVTALSRHATGFEPTDLDDVDIQAQVIPPPTPLGRIDGYLPLRYVGTPAHCRALLPVHVLVNSTGYLGDPGEAVLQDALYAGLQAWTH